MLAGGIALPSNANPARHVNPASPEIPTTLSTKLHAAKMISNLERTLIWVHKVALTHLDTNPVILDKEFPIQR